MNPLQKVIPGQKFSFPARAYNAFVDAAAADANERHDGGLGDGGGKGGALLRQRNTILIKNSSGGDLVAFNVLGIEGPLLDPDENIDQFKFNLALNGVTPTEADHASKFVVLMQPIKDGEIGHAHVDGVFPARVTFTNADDPFADVKNSDSGSLLSGTTGAAKVLWKESGTGLKWAVLRMGAAVLVPEWEIGCGTGPYGT